jgi:sphinganine-1-phosphate aldolase
MKTRADRENAKWENGMVSGAVYSGEKNLTDLSNIVYSLYSLSNPLHPDIWPTVCQCEAEIISMTAGLVNGGDENVVGSTTSGGTESIILAVRAHLEFYGRKRGIRKPEIICCTTAHAALNKACQMFHIRQVQVPCDKESFVLNPYEVGKLVSSNTIMIYSSAPSFPQGVIDPIDDLSYLAQMFDVGLHVDACLGGFVLPFANQMGFDIPRFDFTCPGVTSMSIDTHKYGYATKGTSVVLYRNKALRHCQYFNFPKWPGGLYSTPTIAGSRSGALIVSAWASMVTIGQNGYQRRVKLILESAKEIAQALEKIPGLKVLGDTPAMIVCFGSDDFDIYEVADLMTQEGWSLNSLQDPSCIHLCLTIQTSLHKEKFITDLLNAVKIVQQSDGNKKSGNAAIYGMAGSMPSGPINELLSLYTDSNLSL